MTIVLITGGAGFLGFNLVKHLIKNNNNIQIIVIDNYITSNQEQIKNYINHYDLYDEIICLKEDISKPDFLEKIKSKYTEINEIYHLASIASPPLYKKYPLETLDVGYLGTKNILELCKYYKNCKLLYSSTSEVYGDALQHPQKEDYYGNVNTIGERSCYDVSKRISETLVSTYTKLYNLDTRIVRIFNTYGPYMRINDGRIVTEIIKSLLLGNTLKIFGNGAQTRALNYIDDTINMMLNVMQSDYKSPVNIGNNKEININDLITIAIKVYKNLFKIPSNINIIYEPIDKDDPKVRKPDLTIYKQIINQPNIEFVSLEEGLKRTFLYFKDKIDIGK